MKKYLIGVLFLLLLTACGPSSTPANDSEAETAVDNAPSVAETEAEEESAPVEEEESETPAVTEEENTEEEAEEETAVTAVDGPVYEPASTIPDAAVLRDTDHTKGAEEPVIAIIEYGDFQ